MRAHTNEWISLAKPSYFKTMPKIMWHFSRWKADVIFISADKKEEKNKKQKQNSVSEDVFSSYWYGSIGVAFTINLPLLWASKCLRPEKGHTHKLRKPYMFKCVLNDCSSHIYIFNLPFASILFKLMRHLNSSILKTASEIHREILLVIKWPEIVAYTYFLCMSQIAVAVTSNPFTHHCSSSDRHFNTHTHRRSH